MDKERECTGGIGEAEAAGRVQVQVVREEFARQAAGFDAYQRQFSSREQDEQMLSALALNGTEKVLEIAAGTCALGRMLAPHVSHITEFDLSEDMLEVGRSQARSEGLDNLSFQLGQAENLPFEAEQFDVVACRLAFHHFANPEAVWREMVRVLRPGGKMLVIDMIARDETYRHRADDIERLRDPSHAVTLSQEEFTALAQATNLKLLSLTVAARPLLVHEWMRLTSVPESTATQILGMLRSELAGGEPTGLEPYWVQPDSVQPDSLQHKHEQNIYQRGSEPQIGFAHRWMVLIAVKTGS